jgi:hypothetical protein
MVTLCTTRSSVRIDLMKCESGPETEHFCKTAWIHEPQIPLIASSCCTKYLRYNKSASFTMLPTAKKNYFHAICYKHNKVVVMRQAFYIPSQNFQNVIYVSSPFTCIFFFKSHQSHVPFCIVELGCTVQTGCSPIFVNIGNTIICHAQLSFYFNIQIKN